MGWGYGRLPLAIEGWRFVAEGTFHDREPPVNQTVGGGLYCAGVVSHQTAVWRVLTMIEGEDSSTTPGKPGSFRSTPGYFPAVQPYARTTREGRCLPLSSHRRGRKHKNSASAIFCGDGTSDELRPRTVVHRDLEQLLP